MQPFKRAIVLGLVEMILILPILLAISAFILPHHDLPFWIAMLGLVGLVGFFLARLINRLHTVLGIMIQCAISFFLFLSIFDYSFAGWIGGLLGCITFIRGVLYANHPWEELISTTSLWYGVFFYFVASVMFVFFQRHAPLLPVIYILGSLNLLGALFVGNVLHLRMEAGFSQGAKRVSHDVKRNNYVYVGLFSLVVTVLWLSGIARIAFTFLRDLLLGWLTKRSNDYEDVAPQPPMPSEVPYFDEVAETSEPSWIDTLISILIYLLGGAISLFLLFIILRLIVNTLTRLVRSVLAYWSRRGKKSSIEWGFEDEKNVLLERNKLKPNWSLWTRRSKVKWEQLMNNRDRIRYLYKNSVEQAIEEGFAYRTSDTPSETIRKMREKGHVLDSQAWELLELAYNSGRYGHHDPTDDTIRRLREQLRKR